MDNISLEGSNFLLQMNMQFSILIMLLLSLLSFDDGHAQSSLATEISDQRLDDVIDSLWYSESYIRLHPILEERLQRSLQSSDIARQVNANLALHEFMAFCLRNNEQAISYLISAIDLADGHGLDSLRLSARSKQIYFHQATTRDAKIVARTIDEMKSINESYGSNFFDFVIQQWGAQFVGNKRYIGLSVTEGEVKSAVATVRESINYFQNTPEHLFYYQQVRRIIIAFFNEHFEYDECLGYIDDLSGIVSQMKDPGSAAGNLVHEGIFYLKHKEYDRLIERYTHDEHLLEKCNPGTSKFYYESLSFAYQGRGDYQSALAASELKYYFDKEVNNVAFANKVKEVRANNEAFTVQQKNESLSARNLYILIIAILLFLGLLGLWYFFVKTRKQSKLIEEQRNDLDEANRAKSKLFGILAHDLRGPISSFANLSQKINYLVDNKKWDNLNDMTGQIENSVDNLDSVLGNILPWMSSQISNPKLNKEKVNIGELIDVGAHELSSEIEKKNIQFQNVITPDFIVNLDPGSMRIVFRNLISNALKYSHQGGQVFVIGEKVNEKSIIQVVDKGVGMDLEVQERIFSEYNSTLGTAGEKGYGLGLKLCKDLVLANGGTINIDSRLGGGTTIQLLF